MFRGQIVAISVATGLIGLILLREWIAQQEWHARPPAEEEGDIDPSQWAFRNGHAIRLTDLVHSDDGESNRAEAGDDIGDTGDTETIIADGDQDTVADAGHEEVETTSDGDAGAAPRDAALNGSPERKPERPVLSHAAFDASRRLGESGPLPTAWEGNAEAGPSRGFADVPEDAVPSAPGPSEDGDVASSDYVGTAPASESPRGHKYRGDDFFEALEAESNGPSEGFSSSFRRAADPGPDGNELEGHSERQNGPHGTTDPNVPAITETPPDSPPVDQQDLVARMGTMLEVPEGPDGPSSPDTAGTPETAEYDDGDGILERSGSPIDFTRLEGEDAETDADADPETDANADLDADMDPADEVVEVEDPEWRQWEVEAAVGEEDDDRFVVNVEMVQRVMARNELEGVGMDIPPDDEDDRPLDAEDWDGIFEVVGFIGPLTGLVHNVSLSPLSRSLTG